MSWASNICKGVDSHQHCTAAQPSVKIAPHPVCGLLPVQSLLKPVMLGPHGEPPSVCGELVVGVNFNKWDANALTNGPTPEQPSVGTTNATGQVSGPVAETLQEAGEDPQRLVKVRPAKLADNKLADTSSPASVAAAAANACRLSIFSRLGKHMDSGAIWLESMSQFLQAVLV